MWHVGSSSLTRDQTWAPSLGVRCLSHWTTREVPLLVNFVGRVSEGCSVCPVSVVPMQTVFPPAWEGSSLFSHEVPGDCVLASVLRVTRCSPWEVPLSTGATGGVSRATCPAPLHSHARPAVVDGSSSTVGSYSSLTIPLVAEPRGECA